MAHSMKKLSLLCGAVILFSLSIANARTSYEQGISGPYEVEAMAVADSCIPKVSVSFVDKGYRVEYVADPATIISKKPTYGIVGAFTQYRGVNFRVNDSGSGCNRTRKVTVIWNEQTVIYMPHVSSLGSCRHNLMLHHEMEHVRNFLQVPRDFKAQITQIAATSPNPQRALRNFQPAITAETRRRNNHFHAFERAEPRHLCSSASSRWSSLTWYSMR